MLEIKKPRGTSDLFDKKAEVKEFIEQKIKTMASIYGYSQIRTPMFEHTELFVRGIVEEHTGSKRHLCHVRTFILFIPICLGSSTH